MNREQHLLILLMEECAEVSQRASKALRFGLHEIQKGQDQTNAQRLLNEMIDVSAVSLELVHISAIKNVPLVEWQELVKQKQQRIHEFMKYSHDLGILEG